MSILIYKSRDLIREYQGKVEEFLKEKTLREDILTEEDIRDLPEPVQKYLIYVGAVGKEKVKNMRIEFDGEFKTDPQRDWVKMKAYQYSFFNDPTRQYYIETKVKSLPVVGLHSYIKGTATMLIKLAGLITVADGKGKEMDQGETVTVFNDMCVLAPATLIDERIKWETIDDTTVKATFTNYNSKISATLYFNEKGQLVNFISDDRFYSPTGKDYERVRWSTPVSEYREINGMRLPTYGEAIWHFPEGEYSYARVNIIEVEYNCTSFELK